ncbi:hypothetical protein BU17DRAFT_64744 [Hysterangium stoloniferum]|nr:hypothetical protein BU17DRAFT_64744 [Hysterangium stoloniferum]
MPLPARTSSRGKKNATIIPDPGSLFEEALKSIGYELLPDLKAIWEEVKNSGENKAATRKNVVSSSPIRARKQSILWSVEERTGVAVPADLEAAWDAWVILDQVKVAARDANADINMFLLKTRADECASESLSEESLNRMGVQLSADSKIKAAAQRNVANSSPSPNFQLNPSSQRKRPRGSEGGKSIHKAAEAPTFRSSSPVQSSYRKSLGFDKFLSDIQNKSRIYSQRKSLCYAGMAVQENSTTAPAATTLPSSSSSSLHEGTPDFTDVTTPEPQVARKTASVTKLKIPHPSQGVARKTMWRGGTKRNASDSVESGSSQVSHVTASDNDKSSSDTSSDFDGVRKSSSSVPSPREILSHIGRSKSHVTTRMPYSLDSPTLSRLKNVPDDVISTGHSDMTEPFLPSLQLTTTPPQVLIDAFEMLTINTITLQRAGRLPFLVRNLRASFRKKCQQLGISTEVNPLADNTEVLLTYRYTATSGTRYTYQVTHGRRECPLCSIFGQFSSWQALTEHMAWAHDDVDFAFEEVKSSEGDLMPNLIVHLKDVTICRDSPSPSELDSTQHQTIAVMRPSGPSTRPDKVSATAIEYNTKLEPENTTDPENLTTSRSSSHPSSSSNKLGSSNEATNSSDIRTPDVVDDLGDSERPSAPPILSLCGLSSSLPVPLATSDAQPPTVPPFNNLHGPANPIPHSADFPSRGLVPKTYRPTGPHLFDHLSPLPLEAFGHRNWFVLDKEEEIFELTDVLDEDKVVCALWGRWILLNRSFFIANYIAGVEAFVDEYWLVIHQAAGWGALRAWLLVLVSRRLLKNIEMVQVLKKYNVLVGKDKWPKPADQE